MPILIKGRGVRRLQRKKQNFIQGAFILMLASLLVKVIGAFFQIPLLNMIGGKDSPAFGMFSAAYRVYTAMLMISTVGVPAALAKMVAEATARGREHEVRRTVRVAGSIFIPLGAICSVVLFLGAGTFASWIKSADSRLAVMAIAPSVLMVAVLAVFRGYYQGRSNMVPTAVSQVIESLGKLFIGLGLAYYAVKHNFSDQAVAANDPAVLAIRITIYRLASKAKLVEYLCAAAENGKDVTALIELRARFDEQNNIDWSERMEEAGCKIIYGFEDYKVHSKICLITRRERGAVRHITQVGTGNYNEKTAKQYTDVSLITADERIGQDAGAFFNNMALGNLSGRYSRLFVAPTSLKNNILALMDEQIAKGKDGYILLKFNSLTDIDVIGKLREASCAGVTVEMIVRGICCLLPGVPGHTENITVTSIVGRFLEHSRIYVFGRGDEEKMYISSADLMTRNTERRVEIACPIDDPAVRTRLHDILYAMQHDTVKARVLQPDGTYCKKPAVQDPICAQNLLMQQAIENARKQAAQPAPHPSFLEKIRKWFSGS